MIMDANSLKQTWQFMQSADGTKDHKPTILVCLDPDREEQPALKRGIYLAKAFNANIELVLVVYNRAIYTNHLFSKEQLNTAQQGYIQSQKRWVKTYQQEVIEQGISCELDVVWHKPVYEAINNKAKQIKASLVIKSTHEHPAVNKIFFTPNDWQLIKSCPCPLILAKPSTKNAYKTLVAAIDPALNHDKPATLDHKILLTASQLAKVIKANLNITHCYDPIGYQLWSDIGFGMGAGIGVGDLNFNDENYQVYLNDLKANAKKLFDKVVDEYQFNEQQLHLVQGYPEELLPRQVKALNVDLLVLGSVYHSGLVGSTAEKILDQVDCDILTVNLS